ncbi:hypothetical protein LPW11_05885 [Geomonas sp. RF6]|uniref:hypothetical protein n=1 Tax=Geomonas sp. RF6 TaxID=2897342 RepID=UPI001E5611DC|nr:hypothetical protein [Geomonas sp. RF6]UFS71721.1 hypothetical protein LPW11_05885 [Geomonas sp. RF6]
MKVKGFCAAAAVFIAVTGCTQFTGYKASSHIGYPNANVTPIGPGTGSATKCTVMLPALISSAMQEEAISQAVASRRGALLIDFAEFRTDWTIPLLYLNINCVKYSVEGTVAKQEIGLQKLK